ncbi:MULTISPECIES: S8 family serine peptidase [unclassified Bacillus (in: firmicutes)]|uniref:S8 family serine peptidase n=1 Tax=unclassified Bacillus (in: firmicutes) TaxID=185979 RepID=UPI0008EEC02A|nr:MULTISPECIES: S8 family serine peptidase [unclassified Bacillus (in: firmicutes)]SFB03777.1 minor extracellular serine protease Vpr [Bacillus sp. UNCCL13]SFQ88692.1 minor extracellular serine protease Vpr [Bacillus sp. cl95]
MAKKITILLVILMISAQWTASGRALEHPPIPVESTETSKIAIVITKKPLNEQEIKTLLEPYQDLELRYVFKHALTGFSVKGKSKTLQKLEGIEEVQLVSHAQSYSIDGEESVKMIGAEDVRGYFDRNNQRITGKGITVGVIDTGIDYNHPDLRRNYGGGRDLVDQDDDPMETLSSAGAPTLHGTHVAGIIAANGKIKGVAPEAKIKAYRALGPGGSGTTEQVIAGIEQAIKDKVDVVNLSLGNSINGPDLPISLALNKAVDSGIVAVTSSGNSGPGIWTVGSPGTATKAISVGASTPVMKVPFLQKGGTGTTKLEAMAGAAEWNIDRSLQIAEGGIGLKEDMKNVKNKLVVVKRGRLTFTEKARNALEAGAKAVLIYNNTKGNFYGNLEEKLPIPVAAIPKKAGEELLRSGGLARVHLIEESDRLADFSSRGPVTSTWEIKPDVLAPGVAINSTVPGGYMPLQGTSMAAPHVAGACALLKQAHPDWSPNQIKAALMNAAKPLVKSKELYRTYEQGAGRIQIKEALESQSLVTPSSIQLGKFQLADRKHQHKAFLTIENVSSEKLRYSFDIPKAVEGLRWRMPFSFTLAPKQKKDVEIELTVEPLLLKGKIQDGYLSLKAGRKTIHIPYLYVLEEPGYPRVMGFDLAEGDQAGSYRYEVYLPGGAEEFGIALFDPADLTFKGFLDSARNVKKGMLKKDLKGEQLPEDGDYLIKVFAKKAGKEDMIEMMIHIGKSEVGVKTHQ